MHARFPFLHRFVTVSSILLAAAAADAGVNRWTRQGPAGATVRDLVVDPERPGHLYLGTEGRGVFESADGGRSWAPASRGLAAPDVVDLAVEPGNPRTLYAATSGGVFKSTNEGRRWRAASDGLPAGAIRALAIDPSDPDVLYAGLALGHGVFKSTDGGESWAAANEGLVRPYSRIELAFLAIDPVRPATLYAFVDFFLFKTTDGGLTWERKESLRGFAAAFLIDPADPDNLWAACGFRFGDGFVLRSTDGGETWETGESEAAMPGVFSLALAADEAGTLYAGTREGKVFKSFDGGRRWHLVDGHSFRSSDVLSLAVDPAKPERLWAGTTGGVFRSPDGGGVWRAGNAGLDGLEVSKVVVDPTDPDVVYTATRGGGVFASADRGHTWTPAVRGPANAFVDDLVIDPLRPSVLYAAAGTFYRSRDGGQRWKENEIRPWVTPVALLLDPLDSTIVYSGSTRNGVHRSTDQGRHWLGIQGILRGQRVEALAAGADGTLYAAHRRGVLRSRNRGDTWYWARKRLTADQRVLHVAVDPTDPGVLYAVVQRRGVYKSTDGGATWETNGALAGSRLRAVVVDPWDPETLYAVTLAAGVRRSTDGGTTWSPFNAGLPTRRVNTVTVDPSDASRLYVGTDRGVFAIDVVE